METVAYKPVNALDRVVVARPIAVGTRLPEARDAAIHQARIDRAQRLVVQAIALHVADLEVLDEDVAMRHQRAHQRLAGGLRDVAGDRALVAVGTQVIGGFSTLAAIGLHEEGWAPAAGVVAAARTLDLDHVGAQVGQVLGAPGAGQHAREVQDADAV